MMTLFRASEMLFRWLGQDIGTGTAWSGFGYGYVPADARGPDQIATTLVDGDAEDLAAARRCTEVRDVEVAIRAEGHTGRPGESGGYLFDIAGAVYADDLTVASHREA